ncbi:MAG: LamG-like jellyroll fold domain-containing protein [Candidatus Diapherotrites archaeon]
MPKGQSSMEYLLILGGAVAVASIVLIAIISLAGDAGQATGEQASVYGQILAGAMPKTEQPVKAYLKLDEGIGITAADSSGNENNGAITSSGQSVWINGSGECFAGSCYSFQCNKGNVKINDAESLHFTDSLKITAWIEPTAFGDTIVSKKDSFSLEFNNKGKVYFSVYTENGLYRVYTNQTLSLNTPYLITASFSSKEAKSKIVVNETEYAVKENRSLQPDEKIAVNTNSVFIGKNEGSAVSRKYFCGKIDEVKIGN